MKKLICATLLIGSFALAGAANAQIVEIPVSGGGLPDTTELPCSADYQIAINNFAHSIVNATGSNPGILESKSAIIAEGLETPDWFIILNVVSVSRDDGYQLHNTARAFNIPVCSNAFGTPPALHPLLAAIAAAGHMTLLP